MERVFFYIIPTNKKFIISGAIAILFNPLYVTEPHMSVVILYNKKTGGILVSLAILFNPLFVTEAHMSVVILYNKKIG
jgi:hypothetical protein